MNRYEIINYFSLSGKYEKWCHDKKIQTINFTERMNNSNEISFARLLSGMCLISAATQPDIVCLGWILC